VLVAVLGVLALAVGAPPASAKSPCWRQILDEWVAKQQVSSTYELHCYPEAIAHVPEDLAQYSNILQDIRAARQLAARRDVRTPQAASPRESRSEASERDPDRSLFTKGFDKLGPDNADSVPLPLLILAGLSLALIAAGATGLVAKHLRGRRAPAA
jgi:hypothetical protein